MPDPLPAQVAGLRERMRGIENEVKELKEIVRGNWDEMKLLLEKNITESKHDNKERDTKVESLQNWKTSVLGAAMVLGLIGSAIGAIGSAVVIDRIKTSDAAARK